MYREMISVCLSVLFLLDLLFGSDAAPAHSRSSRALRAAAAQDPQMILHFNPDSLTGKLWYYVSYGRCDGPDVILFKHIHIILLSNFLGVVELETGGPIGLKEGTARKGASLVKRPQS